MEAGVSNCVSGKICIAQYRVAQIVSAWQPGCEKMEREKIKRKWRENKEMKRKWRENEEIKRKWREIV